MQLYARPISFKPPRLNGLSARLLASHYENNYGGAVRRLNAIRAELATLNIAEVPGFMLNGLKREELIATNSMLLHEVYFDGMAEPSEGGGGEPEGELSEPVRMPRARRAPPDRIDDFAATLKPGTKALVYCAWGFEIGSNCAAKLRERSIDAVTIAGGLGTWRADGLPTEPFKEGDAS